MKSKFIAILILVSLLSSALTIAIRISPTYALPNDSVVVYIDPATTNKNPGDSFFDVYVTIADVTDLFGFDIRVSWDNTLLTLISVDKDTYLDVVWGALKWYAAVEGSYGGGGGGGGGYKLAALSTDVSFTLDPGNQVLFKMHFQAIKSCNFQLHSEFIFDLVKLSDSFWTDIPRTTTKGDYYMSATTPDIHFVLVDPLPSKPFEYCKFFKVEVHVSDICAQLTDYDLKINYDTELLDCQIVDWNLGVLGTGESTNTTAGIVHVWETGALTPYVGPDGLLFTLTFHVQFDNRPEHIWRTTTEPNTLPAHIWLDTTFGDLSFVEGFKYLNLGEVITTSTSVPLTIHLIRGDVRVDGRVDLWDLTDVAAGYDKKSTDSDWATFAKYDLKVDNIIDIFDLVVLATNYGYPT